MSITATVEHCGLDDLHATERDQGFILVYFSIEDCCLICIIVNSVVEEGNIYRPRTQLVNALIESRIAPVEKLFHA